MAPFKAQNMSNNSFPCAGGGEIGRSQVAQAEACGVAPESAMNPVLLKPCGDSRSQVVLHGKVWRTLEARDYYQHVAFLREEVMRAYADLAARFDVVVMEGAGSVAEINLAERDFTNLSIARAVSANSLLVADIERGGVFASILGTLDLLSAEDRATVRCFAVNRFRGDRSLFADGIRILEERSGLPCLGLFPFAADIQLDAEDSLCHLQAAGASHPATAIIRFPHISNTTDFRHLGNATWLQRPIPGQFEFVILPGTKTTLADLAWLRETELDAWILRQHDQGAKVIGICGGYQMLGEAIADPTGLDGTPGEHAGLGLLPVRTIMAPQKTTLVRFARTPTGACFTGYEIHMGLTMHREPLPPFATLEDGTHEGARQGRTMGTYLHGALESAEVFRELFGLTPPAPTNDHYDRMADWLEESAMPEVLSALAGI